MAKGRTDVAIQASRRRHPALLLKLAMRWPWVLLRLISMLNMLTITGAISSPV